jgi:hypothetical protein
MVLNIAPMADFFLCDGVPRPIAKTGFPTSLRPAATLDDRPPGDNGNLAYRARWAASVTIL